jgi:hypothetical protein
VLATVWSETVVVPASVVVTVVAAEPVGASVGVTAVVVAFVDVVPVVSSRLWPSSNHRLVQSSRTVSKQPQRLVFQRVRFQAYGQRAPEKAISLDPE